MNRLALRTLSLPAGFLALALAGCGNGFAPPSLGFVANGAPPPSQYYVDVESKGGLAGIPYFVDGYYKVSVDTFAEDPGPPKTFDKRVAFTGTKFPFAYYGFIGIDRAFTGDTEFRATVAVQSTAEFTSGWAGGYINMNFPPIQKGEDSQAHTYLGASWNETIHGFIVQGWDSNAPVGMPVNFPNTPQVDLRMTRVGGSVVMSARETPPYQTPVGGWTDVVTVADPLPGEDCSLEFGAEGLQESKGKVYLDYFYVGGPTVGGEAETSPMTRMSHAIALCDQARPFLELESPDYGSAGTILASAVDETLTAQQEIDTAIAMQTFQETTRETLARKASERARKAMDKARSLCQAKTTKKNPKTILKSLTDGRGHAVVTIANLGGVKTSSAKKLPLVE